MAELIDRPVLKTADIFVRECLGLYITCHAQGRPDDAQIKKRLKRAQRVAVEFAFIIDPAHARALNEVVRQNFIPQIDHLFRFGEKAVTANVKAIAIDLNGAADPADIAFVFFNDGDAVSLFSQQIGRSQPRWTRANNSYID